MPFYTLESPLLLLQSSALFTKRETATRFVCVRRISRHIAGLLGFGGAAALRLRTPGQFGTLLTQEFTKQREACTRQEERSPTYPFVSALTSWIHELETELLTPGLPVSRATIDEGFTIHTRFQDTLDPAIARAFHALVGRVEALAADKTRRADLPQQGPLPMPTSPRVSQTEFAPSGADQTRSASSPTFPPSPPSRSISPFVKVIDDLRFIASEAEIPPSRRGIAQEILSALNSTKKDTPAIAALIGPPGIGKTYLWGRVQPRLPRSGLPPIYYKSPQAGDIPLTAIRTVVRRIIEATNCPATETIDTKLGTIDAPDEIKRLLTSLVTETQDGGVSYRLPVPSSDVFNGLASTIRALLAAISPVVIVLDDIQWLDDASRNILVRAFSEPTPSRLLLIGREEVREWIESVGIDDVWEVGPLTDQESLRLFATATIREDRHSPSQEISEWAVAYSEGNPFTISETARIARQYARLELETVIRESRQVPITRIQSADADLARLSRIIATASPPVHLQSLREACIDVFAGESVEQPEATLQRGTVEEIFVIDSEGESISFRHDLLEKEARDDTRGSPKEIVAATILLRNRYTAGCFHETHVLSRYIADATKTNIEGSDRRYLIGQTVAEEFHLTRRIEILYRSLQNIVQRGGGTESLLRIDAIEALLDREPHSEPPIPVASFWELAHTAAFLLDDGHRMSRYYTRLLPLSDTLTRCRARELWVSRCYSRLWIAGAWRIGTLVLADLGAISDKTAGWESLRSEGRRNLGRRFLQRLKRYVHSESDGSESTETDEIIGRIAVRLVLPTLSVHPHLSFPLAWLILRRARVFRAHSFTLIGIVYWLIALEMERSGTRITAHLRNVANGLIERLSSQGENISNVSLMSIAYARIMCTDWARDTRFVGPQILQIYDRAIRIGAYDSAGHTASLYCQWLFYHGAPLSTVHRTMTSFYHTLLGIGQERSARSIAKFRGSVNALLEGQSEPDSATGALEEDGEIHRFLSASGDTPGLAGLHVSRMFLSAYYRYPEAVRYNYTQYTPLHVSLMALLYDINGPIFYLGMSAAETGRWNEFNEVRRRLKRYKRFPAAQHRYRALTSFHYLRHGRLTAAARSARSAISAALRNGYPHEAALISEYLGEYTDDTAYLALAFGLYHRWGARPAEARVRRLLENDNHVSPPQTPSAAFPERNGDRKYHSVIGFATANGRNGPSGLTTASYNRNDPDRSGTADAEPRRSITNYFHLLMTTIPDALILMGREGEILLRNEAAYPFVVTSGGEDETISPALLEMISPTIQEAVVQRRQREIEREVDRKIVQIAVTPAPTAASRREVAIVIRDITASRERERQLILADRMTSLGMLASTVAHEVSNPNHIVQLNAQVLQTLISNPESPSRRATNSASSALSAPGAPPESTSPVSGVAPAPHGSRSSRSGIDEQGAISNILEGAQRIDAVVRQVVDYGRGGHEHHWTTIDPVALAERVIQFTRLLVTRSNDGVRFLRCEPLPQTVGIAPLIEQALINLVKNATEAVSAGGGEIALRVDANGRYLVFAVCDQGPGLGGTIDPTGPFQTTRSESGGTGLGLSIVRTIAETHNGRLHFSSDDRYATIAELLIPVRPTR